MKETHPLSLHFCISLVQNVDAMKQYCTMSETKRQLILQQSAQIVSREAMQKFVADLVP